MARSAAQRRARREKRQSLPEFRFMELPGELQLLIICKCDLASVRKLLRSSAYIRDLVLCYPETAMRDMLANIPAPVSSLLRVSWALHSMSDDDLDVDKAGESLRTMDLFGWPLRFPRILPDRNDAYATMRGLLDLFMEVDVAVDLVAQVTPLAISTSEWTLFACSLLVIKIFFQLMRKVNNSDPQRADEFNIIFMKNITPWQIHQAASVERFLEACRIGPWRQFSIIDPKYCCRECLSEKSSYFRYYFSTEEFFNVYPGRVLTTFTSTSLRLRSSYSISAWTQLVSDPGHPDRASAMAYSLISPGWQLQQVTGRMPLVPGSGLPPVICFPALVTFGCLFWDRELLEAWGVTRAQDLSQLGETHRALLDAEDRRRPFGYHENNEHLVEQRLQHLIKEWTRCPIQCSLEEFVSQRSALERIKQNRPPLPLDFIQPGYRCLSCGLDGHVARRCNENTWLDITPPIPVSPDHTTPDSPGHEGGASAAHPVEAVATDVA